MSSENQIGQQSAGQEPFGGGKNAPEDKQRGPQAANPPLDDFRRRLLGRLPERWMLRARDMDPEEVRSLGHMTYLLAFTPEPASAVFDQLEILYGGRFKADPEAYESELGTLPAMLYIETFARMYRLNETTTRRWGNLAALDLARTCLPIFESEREQQLTRASSTHFVEMMIDAAADIGANGLRASIRTHVDLVRWARERNIVPHTYGCAVR